MSHILGTLIAVVQVTRQKINHSSNFIEFEGRSVTFGDGIECVKGKGNNMCSQNPYP